MKDKFNLTLRSIKYMLYGMRNQLFWDEDEYLRQKMAYFQN